MNLTGEVQAFGFGICLGGVGSRRLSDRRSGGSSCCTRDGARHTFRDLDQLGPALDKRYDYTLTLRVLHVPQPVLLFLWARLKTIGAWKPVIGSDRTRIMPSKATRLWGRDVRGKNINQALPQLPLGQIESGFSPGTSSREIRDCSSQVCHVW